MRRDRSTLVLLASLALFSSTVSTAQAQDESCGFLKRLFMGCQLWPDVPGGQPERRAPQPAGPTPKFDQAQPPKKDFSIWSIGSWFARFGDPIPEDQKWWDAGSKPQTLPPTGSMPKFDQAQPPKKDFNIWSIGSWFNRGDPIPRDQKWQASGATPPSPVPPVFQSKEAQQALNELAKSASLPPTKAPGPAAGGSPPPGAPTLKPTESKVQPSPQDYETYLLKPNKLGLETAKRLMPPTTVQPTSTPPAQPKTVQQFVPKSGSTFANPTVQPVSLAPSYSRPGGILLARAAAERMALDLDLEGMHYGEGVIVLAGRRAQTAIDAALFLTSLRLACLPSDPSFSLDPPDPAAWHEQSEQAMELVWDHVKARFEGRDGRSGVFNISARRDLGDFWQQVAPRYPGLKSELVFRPAWLKQTRFGEILYKADVLLKELTVGISLVRPELPFRAQTVEGYVSSARDSVDRGLRQEKGWGGRSGNRLWFDLLPKGDRPGELQKVALYTSGNAIDVSEIHPKMFVRRHELGEDVPGSDPSLDKLSSDVNRRTPVYSAAYQELRDLRDIFRAYVAAVRMTQQHNEICASIHNLALSAGEKVSQAMPEFHPAELFITVAKRNLGSGWRLARHSSVNGGVAVRGRALHSTGVVTKVTPLIAEIERQIQAGITQPKWQRQDRVYVAINIDPREPPAKVPIAATHMP